MACIVKQFIAGLGHIVLLERLDHSRIIPSSAMKRARRRWNGERMLILRILRVSKYLRTRISTYAQYATV